MSPFHPQNNLPKITPFPSWPSCLVGNSSSKAETILKRTSFLAWSCDLTKIFSKINPFVRWRPVESLGVTQKILSFRIFNKPAYLVSISNTLL